MPQAVIKISEAEIQDWLVSQAKAAGVDASQILAVQFHFGTPETVITMGGVPSVDILASNNAR